MVGLGNIDDVYKHYLKVIEENKQLEKKLDNATKALEEIKEYSSVYFRIKERDTEYSENTMIRIGCISSQALAKIKEIK